MKFDEDVYHISTKKAKRILNEIDYTSISQQNQYINAINFLFKEVFGLKLKNIEFKRPRKEIKLPDIIDKSILIDKLCKIKNLKHKAILSLSYSVGLRVSELINIKLEDIDSNRMLIKIKQSKGKKDRYVPLSNNILILLRDYYNNYKPEEFLFNGQNKLQYSSTSCNKLVKKYISNKYHFHTLRHSCFTHLMESGTDLRIIQKIAGHSSSKTTEIYTHVSNKLLSNIKTPI
jgi:site-specific recombinase XerD